MEITTFIVEIFISYKVYKRGIFSRQGAHNIGIDGLPWLPPINDGEVYRGIS
jgi:hypothetical protein